LTRVVSVLEQLVEFVHTHSVALRKHPQRPASARSARFCYLTKFSTQGSGVREDHDDLRF